MKECTAAELKEQEDCIAKIKETDACKGMQKNAACAPQCYCTAANIEILEMGASWLSEPCKVTCGSAAGLRASAFTVFAATAVALVAAR
jgi:hypothetical protein